MSGPHGSFIRQICVGGAGERVNRKLAYLLVSLFSIVAAVSAALGCPFFRNPSTYATAGGAFAYLRGLIDVHRRT